MYVCVRTRGLNLIKCTDIIIIPAYAWHRQRSGQAHAGTPSPICISVSVHTVAALHYPGDPAQSCGVMCSGMAVRWYHTWCERGNILQQVC